jgi:peptidyl-prolyl cis-trans isomerase C
MQARLSFRSRRAPTGWLLAAILGGAGCGPGGNGAPSDESPVLAEIDGTLIRESEVTARLASLPLQARSGYSTDLGRRRLLDQMIEEEVLYRAARDEGMERDEEVRRILESQRRQVLVQAFLDRKQEELTKPSESELKEFYEAHREDYRTERVLRVRILLNSNEQTVARTREVVEDGAMPFKQACGTLNEKGIINRAAGLLPDWVRRGKAVAWIGNHPEFHEAAFSLEAGELSEVIEISLGYLLLRVEEIREARQRPFEEVREDVRGRIVRARSTSGLPELLAELRTRYGVVVHEPEAPTAEELFRRAQTETDASRRVALYEELLERYPGDEQAAAAWFMIGFLRSEELDDPEGAATAFRTVTERFPDSELAQSAQWMLTSSEDTIPVPAPEERAAATGDATEESSP